MATNSSRIALVTGANKGLGFEMSRQIGKAGLRVLMGARDAALGQAAAAVLKAEGIDAVFIHLDLGNPATITAAAETIAGEYGYLDVLVNNAGITDPRDGLPGAVPLDAVRRIFETNFFSTLLVTQAMVPLLRKSKSGRVVNVSSSLGSLTSHADPDYEFAGHKRLAYSASKAALNMLTIHLAAELKGTGIKVNSADPGFTATDLNGHRGYQTIPQGAAEAIRLALLPDDGPTGGFSNSAGVVPW